jgi:hypothetical protein
MTIIEAIKSGMPFKRSKHVSYYTKEWIKGTGIFKECIVLDDADFLADDWEVEDKKVEITRTQLEQACIKVFKYQSHEYRLGSCQIVAALAKELGLD